MADYKYVKDFTIGGKRVKIRANSLDELYEKKMAKVAEMENGLVDGNMTVSEWTKIFLSTYKINVSESTKNDMELRINKHILSEIGSYRLCDITPLRCQQIISAQAGMSFSHIQKLSQELKGIFETAKRNNMIKENPAEYIIVPNGSKGKRRPITKEEREHLLIVAEQYQPFILYKLMLYTGCRPEEAVKCLGSDIMEIDGTPMLHIRGTKTANSDRHVPIPEYFYPEIVNTPKNAPIAPNTTGRMHSESSYDRLLARLRREMNISMGCKVYRNRLIEPLPLAEDFVPYNLRHTYCTDLCRMGVDVRIAQKLMGHASIKITSDIYTHVQMDDLTSAAELINKGIK